MVGVTSVSAPTKQRATRRTAKLDQVCGDAVELARSAAVDAAAYDDAVGAQWLVGDHAAAEALGERLVMHSFECQLPGYRGWRWAVVVTRVPRSKQVTVCETALIPGPDALLAPPWVPWEERLQPGDLGVGDLMPTAADDDRLIAGHVLSDDPAVAEVEAEVGLGRTRVMSREGRAECADRWYHDDHGPKAPIAKSAPPSARCVSCGFFLPLAGSLGALFGVCGNVYAPDDGSTVSADHGCGAHSEVLVEAASPVEELPTVYDDAETEQVAGPEATEEPAGRG